MPVRDLIDAIEASGINEPWVDCKLVGKKWKKILIPPDDIAALCATAQKSHLVSVAASGVAELGDQFGAALVTGVPDCPADFRTTQKHFPFVFAAAKEAVTLRKGTGAAQVKVRAKASPRVAKQIVKPAKRTTVKR